MCSFPKIVTLSTKHRFNDAFTREKFVRSFRNVFENVLQNWKNERQPFGRMYIVSWYLLLISFCHILRWTFLVFFRGHSVVVKSQFLLLEHDVSHFWVVIRDVQLWIQNVPDFFDTIPWVDRSENKATLKAQDILVKRRLKTLDVTPK